MIRSCGLQSGSPFGFVLFSQKGAKHASLKSAPDRQEKADTANRYQHDLYRRRENGEREPDVEKPPGPGEQPGQDDPDQAPESEHVEAEEHEPKIAPTGSL